VRVALTDSAGRGVFATRPIATGEVLHSAQPLVTHPSRSLFHEVCYRCLKRKAGKGDDSRGDCYFCSDACREHAEGFHGIQKKVDWSLLDDHCSSRGLKYPYMVRRLACMVISGDVGADCLDILQPAQLHQGTLIEMEEEFELLKSTFRKAGFQEELTTCILSPPLSFGFPGLITTSFSRLSFFDSISFDQTMVHQYTCKNTCKCIPY
uniref:SET domain-containing protein n=1 Tax=Aegilops tauschii subsp. strangulata TaxID=200361 RepID=A0A453SK05_AEGTS